MSEDGIKGIDVCTITLTSLYYPNLIIFYLLTCPHERSHDGIASFCHARDDSKQLITLSLPS